MVPFLMIFLGDFLMTIYTATTTTMCSTAAKSPEW